MTEKIKSAEILCVGTELLLGDIVNTNAAYLAAKLAGLGISVFRQGVVGDNPGRLRAAMLESLSRADLLITSGGLGPTADDITKETAASLFGLQMHLDLTSQARIQQYFTSCSSKMTANNSKQAMMPQGATIFNNNVGTAPALAIYGTPPGAKESKTIIMLPGPPHELMSIFENEVAAYLRARTDRVIISQNVNLFGIGEAAAEDILRDLINGAQNPTVAIYCSIGELRLRVTAGAENEVIAQKLCEAQIEQIKCTPVLPYIYDIDSPSIEDSVIRRLRSRGQTLSVAESCTGGIIQKRLTDIPGCSDVFMGGCVSYSNESKVKLLGVSPDTLREHGAVSADTAAQMARGVRLRLGTDIGIATTGIAGPGGGTSDKPVGMVYIAISTAQGERVKLLHLSRSRQHGRAHIRALAANEALAQLLFDI